MPDIFGEGSFPAWMISKVLHFQSGRSITKVRLNDDVGREGNESVEYAVSTSADGTTWSDWEYLEFGVIKTLANPGEYVRVQLSGSEGTIFNAKDDRNVNVGIEIEIMEAV